MECGIPVLSPYERLARESQALISVAPRYCDVGRLDLLRVGEIVN